MQSTKDTMRKVVRMMNKFEGLAVTACGHGDLVEKSYQARKELLEYIRRTIDSLKEEVKEAERRACGN